METQSRQHQAVDWPLHKAFCKQERKNYEQMESQQLESPSGLPPLPHRRRLLEDFVGIHHYSIVQGMVSAIHVEDHPFDFSGEHAFIGLSYNPENGGNPSTAFELEWAVLIGHDTGGNGSMAATVESFRPLLEYSDRADKGKPGYLGVLLCVCECSFVTIVYIVL